MPSTLLNRGFAKEGVDHGRVDAGRAPFVTCPIRDPMRRGLKLDSISSGLEQCHYLDVRSVCSHGQIKHPIQVPRPARCQGSNGKVRSRWGVGLDGTRTRKLYFTRTGDECRRPTESVLILQGLEMDVEDLYLWGFVFVFWLLFYKD